MHTRDSSTTILNAWNQSSKLDMGFWIQPRPIYLKNISRAPSATGSRKFSVLTNRNLSRNEFITRSSIETNGYITFEDSNIGMMKQGPDKLLTSSIGGGGGRCCNNCDRGDDGGNSDQGREDIDSYYKKMLREFPNDGLLLANYARHLKNVHGDLVKAEEYCERAILAKERDGDVLSMYGDLVWDNHKDISRAQSYFEQAVQWAPNDCYLLASYARFLMDVGDKDEDEQEFHTSPCKSPLDFSSKGWSSIVAAS
ncbi:hypothetical protein ACFE04_023569 [Oxalis oulophora]